MTDTISRRTQRLASGALVAVALAGVLVAASGDDVLRALCMGLGSGHPLYDILGCPLIVNPPSPEG